MTTTEQIAALIGKVSNRPVPLAEDESLFEAGYLDSFTLTDLAGELERAFSIKVRDADLTPRRFDTLARISAYVEKTPRVNRAGQS